MKKINKDILNLVHYLTHSKSLTREQQARRDMLFAMFSSIEEKKKPQHQSGKHHQSANQTDLKICTIHSPLKVFSFLRHFSINNTALKYTTHNWDKNPDDNSYPYNKFEDFNTEYKRLLQDNKPNLQDLYDLKKHLWSIIKNFLLQKEPIFSWSEFNLKIGYNKYVEEWMNHNPGLQPASMPISAFPKEYQPKGLINGKVLSYFSDVIGIFKQCIEFRDNDLFLAVKKIFKSPDHTLDKKELDSLKGRAIYTDTELVKDALRIIAANIFQRSMYPEIKISCKSETIGDNKVVVLRILQIGSYSNRDINDPKIKAAKEEGDFYRIKSKLTNLCDFAIESNFRIKNTLRHCRINFLSSDNNAKDIVLIEDRECQGFSYLLTFYTV